ncbi:MAG TPA: MFS transporter, partial [Acidimicrobiales bacterium]
MPADAGWQPLQRPSGPHSVDLAASPFARLAVAHSLTVAGDALLTTALAGSLFFDISPSAARGRVALSLALSMAPFAVVAPFLGPAVDRVRGGRRAVVVAVSVLRAATCVYMATVLHSLLLFPAAFAALVLGKTHSVTKSSLVPTVVRSEDELVEANSKLALAGVVAGLVAAAPGVAVLKLAGAEWALRLAAVVFLLAAVAATRIVTVRPDTDEPEERAEASVEVRDAGIVRAAAATAVLRASVGFLTFLVAFALRR